ncbi:MAG: hypothetical protein ACOCRX_06905 [Candidatus Woesearchaeota archaeon]
MERKVYFAVRNEKELEFNVYQRSYMFHASQKKSYDGKTIKSIEATCSQLNHFILYLEKRKEDQSINESEGDLGYFIVKMIRLNDLLNRNKMEQAVWEEVKEKGTRFYDEKLRYFKKVVREELVNDVHLCSLISDYIYSNTLRNLTSAGDIKEKLYYSDIHIYHCLSVYTKMLYFMYFRFSDQTSYKRIAKSVIIDLSSLINQMCLDIFPREYSRINNTSFMDRLFNYIQFVNRVNTRTHTKLADKFTAIGYSEESLSIKMLDSVLSSLKNFGVVTYDRGSYKRFNMFEHDYKNWGYVAKNTAAVISSTTKRTVNYMFAQTTPHVINKKSPTVMVDGVSESSKYEILLEKKNKEHYQDMNKIKKYIVNDCYTNISDDSKEEINNLMESDTDIRHQLNKFMVSLFLEQNYEANVLDLITYEEFLIILYRVYERMDKYYRIKHALISPVGNRLNGIRVREKDLENLVFFENCNKPKTMKILNKIVGYSYTFNRDVVRNLNIKDELVKFIKEGLII